MSEIINGERSSDLTDQKQPHTNNLDVHLGFFLVSMASMTIPLPIVAGPSNNGSINASTATSLQLAYAQPSQDNNTITAHLSEPFQLRINQTAIIMPDNMSMILGCARGFKVPYFCCMCMGRTGYNFS